MVKLIPLSSKVMKEMGLVKTKTGFMMSVKNGKVKADKDKTEVKSDKKETQRPVEQRVVVSTMTMKEQRAQEKQRREDRGVY